MGFAFNPNNNIPYISYRSDINNSVSVAKFDTIWDTVPHSATAGGKSGNPHVEFASNGTLYLAYEDDANGGGVTVKIAK